jgi:DNA-binding response OmpR family regulator
MPFSCARYSVRDAAYFDKSPVEAIADYTAPLAPSHEGYVGQWRHLALSCDISVKSKVYVVDGANGRGVMGRKRILVIEDERDIADLIRLHLEDLDHVVTIARDGNAGLRTGIAGSWDLIILDLRLPGVDGLEICRHLREGSKYVPILMLTSKSSELDRVVGLEVGADDYVVKPFSVLELMARVKAILRRAELFEKQSGKSQPEIHLGCLTINSATRNTTVRGKHVELTAREFDLLFHFARHPSRVFRRAELLDSVWGYGHDGYEHTVNSHINRLRAKIENDPAHPELIVTVWGVGYKMNATPTFESRV